MNLLERWEHYRDNEAIYLDKSADFADEMADRIEALEKGYRILIKQWDSCSNMGYCPDLGYPIEDWCVYCIAQAALNKGTDQ